MSTESESRGEEMKPRFDTEGIIRHSQEQRDEYIRKQTLKALGNYLWPDEDKDNPTRHFEGAGFTREQVLDMKAGKFPRKVKK